MSTRPDERIREQVQESVMDGSPPRKPESPRPAKLRRGRSSYWLDATTANVLCRPAQWEVRDSFDAALDDVRQTCRRLDPGELRLLMIDGVVTFRIIEETAERGRDTVWSWDWDENGPPTEREPSIGH